MKFLKGLKESGINLIKVNTLKNVKNLKDVDLFISLNSKEFNLLLNSKVKLFGAFLDKNLLSQNLPKNVVGILVNTLPFYKIFMEIKSKFKTIQKIGIVLHNKELIKNIAKLMIYNPLIKIYDVKNKSEILYKFKKALTENDFIMILPDDFVLNYFTFQKIIKMLKDEDKPFGGYSKYFLNYGAKFAFEIDYEKIGKCIGSFLKKINKNSKFKIFSLKFVKFYFKNE